MVAFDVSFGKRERKFTIYMCIQEETICHPALFPSWKLLQFFCNNQVLENGPGMRLHALTKYAGHSIFRARISAGICRQHVDIRQIKQLTFHCKHTRFHGYCISCTL